MTGFFVRFFSRALLLYLLISGLIIYISSQIHAGELSRHNLFFWLFHYNNYIKNYIINDEYFTFYLSLYGLISLYLLYWGGRNFKYLNLPYAMGLYNQARQFEGHQKRTKVHFDKFIKKKKYEKNKFSLFFKNWIAVEPKNYNDKKEAIAQYLGWDGDIKVYQHKERGIELFFYKLPTKYKPSIFDVRVNAVVFGKSMNGLYTVPFAELTHTVVVGESGSGKSNFLHYLLDSFFKNNSQIDKVELIDLKGTELFGYKNYKNVQFTDNIQEVRNKFSSLKDEMLQRFELMKVNSEQLYSGKYHFIIIDEVGTIGTYPDKKLRDEIFNLMIEIAQKGRAAKILLFIFAQKIDSTNIPSNVLANLQTRVLMKTDSDFNINNTIGKKEDLENITRLNPDSFPRGRAIIKNGYTSEKVLVQFPLIELKKEYCEILAK